MDLSWLADFSKAKPKLRTRLYNKTTEAEISYSAKDYGFDDLIFIPYVEDVIENGSVKVDKRLLDLWKMTADEVIRIGLQNGKEDAEVISFAEILGPSIPIDFPVYVVTNGKRMFGASRVVSVHDRLEELFPDGYWVIPSSIHEVLVVSVDAMERSDLASTIIDVNKTTVLPEDVLGEKPYQF